MIGALLAVILWIHPVLDEPGEVRLVSQDNATWIVQDELVAMTGPRTAATVSLPAGSHELKVETADDSRVFARPVVAGAGVHWTQAWLPVEATPLQEATGAGPGLFVLGLPALAWTLVRSKQP